MNTPFIGPFAKNFGRQGGRPPAVREALAGFVAGLAALAIFCARAEGEERVLGKEIYPERELLITAPAIVDSETAQYPGAWSFGGLMDALVGADNAGACVRDWLETWNGKQTVNGQEVAPRYAIYTKLILQWQQRDGYQPDPAKPWTPQMRHAPFRLLAIVNRMDLCAPAVAGTMESVQAVWRLQGREKMFLRLLGDSGSGSGGLPAIADGGYGSFGLPTAAKQAEPATAGEGRLVFGAVDVATGAPLEGGFTVILEYHLEIAQGVTTVRDWARSWHSLGAMELADPAYPAALEKLTRSFTEGKGASLAQLRTNEAAFGEGREFRQFGLLGVTLQPATLTQTPAPIFAEKNSPEQRRLNQFLREQDVLIRSGINHVPESLPERNASLPLLGGSALSPTNEPNFYWNLNKQVPREARHLFSLNTCTGCHGGETGCAEGLHIHPRAEGAEAVLSSFLR